MDPRKATPVKSGGFSVVDDFQSMYANKGKFKNQLDEIVTAMRVGGNVEKEPSSAKATESKPEVLQEVLTQPELEKNPELSGYIEKVEKMTELTSPVMDDYTKKVLLGSATPQKVKINLPLTEPQIEEGLHHKVWEAVRWMAEWCLRQLKIIKKHEILDTTEV